LFIYLFEFLLVNNIFLQINFAVNIIF